MKGRGVHRSSRSFDLKVFGRPNLVFAPGLGIPGEDIGRLATRDIEVRTLAAIDEGVARQVTLNVTGLAGFLMAKAAAARSRRKPKDWYDIAFVLLHNDLGDAATAARRVQQVFGSHMGSLNNILADLRANFDGPQAQGTLAYMAQVAVDHPETDTATAAADCQLAVLSFCETLLAATPIRTAGG
jgi:hypothetical protein